MLIYQAASASVASSPGFAATGLAAVGTALSHYSQLYRLTNAQQDLQHVLSASAASSHHQHPLQLMLSTSVGLETQILLVHAGVAPEDSEPSSGTTTAPATEQQHGGPPVSFARTYRNLLGASLNPRFVSSEPLAEFSALDSPPADKAHPASSLVQTIPAGALTVTAGSSSNIRATSQQPPPVVHALSVHSTTTTSSTDVTSRTDTANRDDSATYRIVGGSRAPINRLAAPQQGCREQQPDVQPDVQPDAQPDVQPDVRPDVRSDVQPDVQFRLPFI